MTLSEKLIDYRAKNRISQSELAKKLGVSPTSVCNWETGSTSPHKSTARRIEIALGFDKEEDKK